MRIMLQNLSRHSSWIRRTLDTGND
jgi:hypothetical protein